MRAFFTKLCPHPSLVFHEGSAIVEVVGGLSRWPLLTIVGEPFRIACHAFLGLRVNLGMEEAHRMIACAMCIDPTAPLADEPKGLAQPKLS